MEKDIIIESDLKIVNGDISIEPCTNQNIKHLIIATPGNYYNHPKTGADIYKYQNSSLNDYRSFDAAIKDCLKKDGYGNIVIKGTSNGNTGDISITAERVNVPSI